MKKLFFLFLLLPVLSFKPQTNGQDVFFGDSITFGNELGTLQYTARWSAQYCSSVPSNEINDAQSGAAMTPGLNSGRPVFNIGDVPGYNPSFRHIFVSYWVNDYCYGGTPASFAAATTNAVDGILARGWPADKIVLCFNYLPESGTNTWPYITDNIARQWLAALRSVQQAKGTSFLDFYSLIYNRPDKASYSGDGIHPTATWNAEMKAYALNSVEPPSTTLPVTLTGFSAQRQGTAVSLLWTVAQESEVARYIVERSENGTTWNQAGELASLGNSTTARTYRFADNNAGAGRHLYRLKIVDKNGATRYSSIVIVNDGQRTQLSMGAIFPNPATTGLNVTINTPEKGSVNMQVLNATGHTVRTQQQFLEAGANTIAVPLTGIAAGTYILRLLSETDGKAVSTRFVKE